MEDAHKPFGTPVVLAPCPNADKLSLVRVDGFQCVTATEQWAGRDRGVFVRPDSEVDTKHPAFAFLAPKAKADGWARVRAVKIRGQLSEGLLVPYDDPDALPVRHYEPPETGDAGVKGQGSLFEGGAAERDKPRFVADFKYDLDNGKKPRHTFIVAGTPCWVTEKLHGANARYVFDGHRLWCGSRNEWKREYPNYDHVQRPADFTDDQWDRVRAKMEADQKTRSMWWNALTPEMETFCRQNPGAVLWGEVYGQVGGFPYDTGGKPTFRAFDVWTPHGPWRYDQFQDVVDGCFGVPTVPFISDCPLPYDALDLRSEAEGQSLIGRHVREGVVVRPEDNSERPQKFVGAGYLLKELGDTEETCSTN